MSQSVTIASRLFDLIECCNCGVEFLMPHALNEQRLADKGLFHCPNGHNQHYTKSLRDTLATTQRDLGEAIAARDKAEAEIARLKERQRRGICTFCKRTFGNVAAHMATKHHA